MIYGVSSSCKGLQMQVGFILPFSLIGIRSLCLHVTLVWINYKFSIQSSILEMQRGETFGGGMIDTKE